jgi:phospholipase C
VATPTTGRVRLVLANPGPDPRHLKAVPNAYGSSLRSSAITLATGQSRERDLKVTATGGWYDLSIEADGYLRRLAGRLETGHDTISDPAMGGIAIMDQAFRR